MLQRPRKLDSAARGPCPADRGAVERRGRGGGRPRVPSGDRLGAAGVGKSRLVDDFVDGLGGRACVLRGRCLPYGEGITYWPLAEIVRDLRGEEGDRREQSAREPSPRRLADDPKAELIASRAGAIRSGSAALPARRARRSSGRSRRLFEALARDRPLVIVIDDLQWAEPTFLDLVEHVADLARDAPVVLLCIGAARAARGAPRLGRREAERRIDPPGAARPGRVQRARREPAQSRQPVARGGRAHRRCLRGQPAVRRGAARDVDRRRAASKRGRALGARGRAGRAARAAHDPCAARSAARAPARGGARAARARLRGGHGLPSRGDARAGAGGARTARGPESDRAGPQGR